MTSIRKVALVGASGRLGTYILAALQGNSSFEVTAITRQSSKATFSSSTKVLRVGDDYPTEDMISAFKGQDAVILSLGYGANSRLKSLAEASRTAGVKRFIANHYGGSVSKEAASFFPISKWKEDMVQELKELQQDQQDWTWTGIACGLFFDFCIKVGFFGIDPQKRKARIVGSGDTMFSATNLATIGEAVVRVLLHAEETANRMVFVSSFETSLHEILEVEKKIVGAEGWEVEYVDADEEVKNASEEYKETGSFFALGRLGLCAEVKEGLGADLQAQGLLDNELLGLKDAENVDATIKRVLTSS